MQPGAFNEILKTAILNGYVDFSEDTWIRNGVSDDNSLSDTLLVGLCNPFKEDPDGGVSEICVDCQCGDPPGEGFTLVGVELHNGECQCQWVSGSGPFQQIIWTPADCPPPVEGSTRAPTRSALFFRLLDPNVSYDGNADINARLPDGITASKIKSAKLVLTVKGNNGWPKVTDETPPWSGAFDLFADPDLLIALPSSDALYAGFAARLVAASTPYTYISGSGISGYVPQTSDACIADFDALSDAKKAGYVMVNCEFPWLDILSHGITEALPDTNPADGIVDWQADPAIISESLAQGGGAPDSSWSLADYQSLAVKCWTNITDTLKAKAIPPAGIVHYATTTVPFSSSYGVPSGALRYSAPVAGTADWFKGYTAGHPTLEDQFAASVSNGKLVSLRKAQAGAIDGAAAYSFDPNSGKAVDEIDRWDNSAERYDYAGTLLTPDFTSEDLDAAVAVTSRRMWGEYRKAIQDTIDSGGLTQSDYPETMAAIVFGSGINAHYLSSMVVRQARFGLYAKGAAASATNEIAAMFEPPDLNWPVVGPPDQVWVWHSGNYYFWTEPSRTTDPTHPTIVSNPNYLLATNMMRWSHEVDFLQRPWPPTADDFPWGATADSTVHEWYADNRLGDDWWTNQSSVWWTVAGGSQLPAPCVLDQTSPLAQYLDWTADIGWIHIRRAVRAAISEQLVSGVEQAKAAVDLSGL